MKFLVTLNMPTYDGNLTHQLTLELDAVNSLKDFYNLLNEDEFIIGNHWFRKKNMYTQKSEWHDRGHIIINTAHIGKVAEFIDFDEDGAEDSQKASTVSRFAHQGPRRPMRP